jgi:hypothetical protein
MSTITGGDVLLLSREEVARRAQDLYEKTIRAQVEEPANIGKMIIIDIETGDFGVDELGFDSANALRQKNPNARLFGIRIGYDVAASLGGMMKRTAPEQAKAYRTCAEGHSRTTPLFTDDAISRESLYGCAANWLL